MLVKTWVVIWQSIVMKATSATKVSSSHHSISVDLVVSTGFPEKQVLVDAWYCVWVSMEVCTLCKRRASE